MSDYSIDSDLDLNKYESEDIKDLTLTGIGEAMREVDLNIGLIVILIIIVFVLSTILVLKVKGKKILG